MKDHDINRSDADLFNAANERLESLLTRLEAVSERLDRFLTDTDWQAHPEVRARPVPNRALLLATVGHIEAHPDQWDQDWWRHIVFEDDVRACYGTRALILSGHATWIYPDDHEEAEGVLGEFFRPEPGDDPSTIMRIVNPFDRAQRVLGLTLDQANALFAQGNTLVDLRRIVAQILRDGGR